MMPPTDAAPQTCSEASPSTPREVLLGYRKPAKRMAIVLLVAFNLLGGAATLLIGIESWRRGLPKPLAAFPLLLGGSVLIIAPFAIRTAMHGVEFVLTNGVIQTRTRKRRRTLMRLAVVQELILWKGDFPGLVSARSGENHDMLVLLKRPWGDLSSYARKNLRQSPAFIWPRGKTLHASWFERPLIDVAAMLATHIEAERGSPPPVSLLRLKEGPTPLEDLPRIFDWPDAANFSPSVMRSGSVCLSCGYDLRGLAKASACPECGQPIQRSVEGYSLRSADGRWLKGLANGAATAAIGGLGCSAAVASYFVWAIRLSVPPSGTSVYSFAIALLILAGSLTILVGGWKLTSPEPLGSDQQSDKLRTRARKMWLFPPAVAFLGWTCGTPDRQLIVSLVASILIPSGHLVIFAGALLSRLDMRKRTLAAMMLGSLAAFAGFMIPSMLVGTRLVSMIVRFFPGLSGMGGTPGGPAVVPAPPPAGATPNPPSVVFATLLNIGVPIVSLCMGVLVWSPLIRLWRELRSLTRNRDAA